MIGLVSQIDCSLAGAGGGLPSLAFIRRAVSMLMLRYPSRLGNMFIVNAGLAMYYLWQAISVVLAQVRWSQGAERVPPPAHKYRLPCYVCSTNDVVVICILTTTSCGFGGLAAVFWMRRDPDVVFVYFERTRPTASVRHSWYRWILGVRLAATSGSQCQAACAVCPARGRAWCQDSQCVFAANAVSVRGVY